MDHFITWMRHERADFYEWQLAQRAEKLAADPAERRFVE